MRIVQGLDSWKIKNFLLKDGFGRQKRKIRSCHITVITFLICLHLIFLIQNRINCLDEITQRHCCMTVVASIGKIAFRSIKVSSGLILVLLGITTERASEVIEVVILLYESLHLGRKKCDKFFIHIQRHTTPSIIFCK